MLIKCSLSQKRFLVFCLIASPFLSGIGIDLYVPSLPIIASELHALKQFVQLTISTYLLGYGLGQLFLGVLSDSFGRKKIIFFSSLCYAIVSILCSLSPNVLLLNLGRFLQGVCFGGILSTCRAMATDCFSGLALNKIMTYISISWSLGPIIGPFIGGYLQYYLNWQADFYFFALCGLSIFVSSLVMPETNHHLQKFHPLNILKSVKYIAVHPVFLYSTIVLSLTYALLVIFNVVGPFLIEVVLKYSVIDFGHVAVLLGFGYFLGGILNRFLIYHLRPMSISFFCLMAALLVSLFMVACDAIFEMNIYTIFFPTVVLFFFCGLNFPNLITKVMSLFPKMAGIASAVYGLFVSGFTFFLTGFATLLDTETQLPTSLMYAGLLFVCLLFFLLCKRHEKSVH